MANTNKLSTSVMMTVVMVLAATAWGVTGELSMEYYYMQGCPMAEMIVRDVMSDAIMKDPTLAASILRLHFHDCFVQGCDASLLLDSTPGHKAEKDAPPNRTLRGFKVIDAIKEVLEEQCPSMVSCADILALAARDAVVMAGGPYYDVPTGRKDGFRSDAADTAALPAATLNASALVDLFVDRRGFSVEEMVALSGGHTLGVAHCANFKNRLSNFDSTSQVNRGLLTSDQTLADSPETAMFVNMFAENSDMFFYTFQQGMLKMGQLDLKEQGDVRKSCRVLN
ncbi:hypothetical protein PR202_ga18449 [Eleusine coracana subsp. coracana]|uniref:Peroxidase n=1 Tax=Eleusine coracana subsp. coracana TaxID=191504 RepID=A0AAV5CRV9_ELECO|nr:hypothetical protein PR202_ga18449 [Eleusine coracana subsp. coracana]